MRTDPSGDEEVITRGKLPLFVLAQIMENFLTLQHIFSLSFFFLVYSFFLSISLSFPISLFYFHFLSLCVWVCVLSKSRNLIRISVSVILPLTFLTLSVPGYKFQCLARGGEVVQCTIQISQFLKELRAVKDILKIAWTLKPVGKICFLRQICQILFFHKKT